MRSEEWGGEEKQIRRGNNEEEKKRGRGQENPHAQTQSPTYAHDTTNALNTVETRKWKRRERVGEMEVPRIYRSSLQTNISTPLALLTALSFSPPPSLHLPHHCVFLLEFRARGGKRKNKKQALVSWDAGHKKRACVMASGRAREDEERAMWQSPRQRRRGADKVKERDRNQMKQSRLEKNNGG